ncbi:hypothetical protein FAVG1_03042 [Fusarium avenaceum]|nr:hypothetical protein FAVG1_03042 [Fusarium avenaceum]
MQGLPKTRKTNKAKPIGWIPRVATRRALQEIRYTNHPIPQAAFARLVRGIVQDQHPGGQLGIEPEALELIHESTEQLLTEMFTGAQIMANHTEHVTLQARDLHTLANILRSFRAPGYDTAPFMGPTAYRGSNPLISTQKTPPSAGPKNSGKRPRKTLRVTNPEKGLPASIDNWQGSDGSRAVDGEDVRENASGQPERGENEPGENFRGEGSAKTLLPSIGNDEEFNYSGSIDAKDGMRGGDPGGVKYYPLTH